MNQPQLSVGTIPAYSSSAFVEGPPIAAISARRGNIEVVVSSDPFTAAISEKRRLRPAQGELSPLAERGGRL